MKIYLASSWRNPRQPYLVDFLRDEGHEVYDFRNPPTGTGFAWREVGLEPSKPVLGGGDTVPVDAYLTALDHARSRAGFESDFTAMQWADACVLLLPCGRSAHLELGWAVGAGKERTAVLLDDPCTPELMYRMVDCLATSTTALRAWLDGGPR